MIEYRRCREFTEEQLGWLFRSVGWYSGRFPERLKKAMGNSSRVISAWDGERLVGLIRGLDDGVWQASIDCLLVDPEYQGRKSRPHCWKCCWRITGSCSMWTWFRMRNGTWASI